MCILLFPPSVQSVKSHPYEVIILLTDSFIIFVSFWGTGFDSKSVS